MLWFKHFGDARRNPKLLRIERKIGESGYARFFKLLEIIAERGGKGSEFRPEIDLNGAATDMEWLSSELKIETDAVRETLDLFAHVGLIDEGAWNGLIILVPQMLEYRDEYTGRLQNKNSRPKAETEKEKETEEEAETEEEQNGDRPDTVPSVSGDETESDDKQLTPASAWLNLDIAPTGSSQFVKAFEDEFMHELDDEYGGLYYSVADFHNFLIRFIQSCRASGLTVPKEFLAAAKKKLNA
jgi:hypothetical protein